jgi:hypothetical protein
VIAMPKRAVELTDKTKRNRRKISILLSDFLQQRLDALGFIFDLVIGKFDGWNESKIQLLSNFGANETGCAFETGQSFHAAFPTTEETKIDFRLPQIFANPSTRQSDGLDAWIPDFFT